MDGLRLRLRSYADMTEERAADVGRVFDEHPGLRPRKVGGDPARIKVEPSLEAIMRTHGLPLQWLTVRHNGRYPDCEFGQMDLFRGRGGWVGEHVTESGQTSIKFSLIGQDVEQHWLAATVADSTVVEEVESLFISLSIAMDAAYGFVAADSAPDRNNSMNIRHGLPGVFWLNYFGPAFLVLRPELATQPGARVLSTGGVLIRTSPEPWRGGNTARPAAEEGLAEMLGADAFSFTHPHPPLPTLEEHLVASPGTMEMPWEAWQSDRDDQARARRYSNARKRLDLAMSDREPASLDADAVEWSTSMDLADWRDLTRFVGRRMGGDFSGKMRTILVVCVENAPVGDDQTVAISTRAGSAALRWTIEDDTTVEVSVHGPDELADVIESWFSQ